MDFVNTVQDWTTPDAHDYLQGFGDFLRWNEMTGLLGAAAVRRFRRRPGPEQAAALRDVRALRENLHGVFAALAGGERPPQKGLEYLNRVIRRTVAWRGLAADESGSGRRLRYVWEFRGAPAAAALGPVAWRAADLLELGDTDRLKTCPGERCGWLFLDTSKNRSRTWCSMKACGNAAKVRRFRQRHRQ